MDITPIAAVQTPLVLPAQEPPQPSSPTGGTQTDAARDSVTITATSTDKTLQLGHLNEGSNSVALQTGAVDQKLSVVSDAVGKMKEALDTIVKNFPPFPPDSSERQKLLMSYLSIKKELVKMIVPAPPPPLYEKVKPMWDNLFPAGSPDMSQLPGEMSDGTPDTELRSSIIQLKHLQQDITSIRTTLKQSLSES
ncbi:hypothetical protein FO488_17390 [Geobacter sp. FeAm09]|uniref:hypothetical protein n=1 Tax=Geobacter sp. FeAm09 TaxID=2597769 RepID=UPI0011EC1C53|nr:hypothetical protein [Geobacter sp. FeAm09]QEM69753.1 hypothetical protein FO488_17390 [Geobacter sp. FeAm09]